MCSFVNNAPTSREFLRTSSATCLRDSLEPLAEEGAWQAFLDEETTGLIYYFDSKTGESLWEPPTDTFPQIRLTRQKQRLADDLRREYRKTRQQDEMSQEIEEEYEEQQESNWIAGLLGKDEKFAAEAEEAVEESIDTSGQAQRRQWFNNMFDNKKPPSGIPTFKGEVEAAPEKKQTEVKKQKKEKFVPFEPTPLKIETGSFVSPHPAKVRWGGEDALFIKGRTFGVFDGVSGAEKLDGVPLYSRTLADEMKKAAGKESMTVAEMTKSLTAAADYADQGATGASTAVVASIGENGFLQALSLGDSYCMVIRDGKITAKTREISHYWECPYQLSDDSPDRPRDGTKLNIELIPGDIIVMGSDGIFDNIGDDMLLDVISKGPKKPPALAKKICDVSRKQSLDRNSLTPFGKQSQKRGDADYKDGLGGKVDDSSCVVVFCK